MSKRTLCVHLPFLQTERLLLRHDPAQRKAALLAVTVRRNNTLMLAAVSEGARECGIHPGMTFAQARAIAPELEAIEHNKIEEKHALGQIAEVVYSYAPRVRLQPPLTIVVDVLGCERLHGSESMLVQKLHADLSGVGWTTRIALADNPAAAVALAAGSNNPTLLSAPGRAIADLRDILLARLELPTTVSKRLASLGLSTIGQLLDLPAEALPSRFGDDLARLLRQLNGIEDPPLEQWQPIERLKERVDFEGPTDNREALVEALKLATRSVAQKLDRRSSGALGLQIDLLAAEGPPVTFTVTLAAARGTAKALNVVVLNRFETIDLQEKWFEGVQLTLLDEQVLPELQHDLFQAGTAEVWRADIAATIDELTGKLGAQAVVRAERTGNPDPTSSWRYVPWNSVVGRAASPPLPPGLPARIPFAEYQQTAASTALPRLWRFPAGDSALKVIGSNCRFGLGAAHSWDCLLVEDERGQRHFVRRDNKHWHLPPKLARHESQLLALDKHGCHTDRDTAPYAELVCATNFSFLRGARGPAEMVMRAAEMGLHAIGITDRHTLAGVVRAHAKAKELGIKLLIGTRLILADGPDLCLYAMNRLGYSNICRLLTTGKLRTVKGSCELALPDLADFAAGLQVVVMNGDLLPDEQLAVLRALYADRLSLAVSRHFEPRDYQRKTALSTVADRHGIPPVVVNDAHACRPQDQLLQAVVSCVREKTTLAEGVAKIFPNGERHLKAAWELNTLFEDQPAAVARSVQIADACTFSMDELAYEYPDEVVPAGTDMQAHLENQTWLGAQQRYPEGVPSFVATQVKHELALIKRMGYAAYFLTIHDIVNFARSQKIECQGRGSAANSAACYCLGITEVPPREGEQLFERFISQERNEPPDIDVDFEHERREEVLQYIYDKYGRHRAGICSTVITYRFRSAVRDAGKVLGYSLDQVDRIAKSGAWWDKLERARETMRESGVDPNDGKANLLLYLVASLLHAPRHLSQHVGGFVITRGRLDELVPIENAAMKDRTFIEWNRDDIDALGILKVDCLGLGMLAALRRTFDLIEQAGGKRLSRAGIMQTDPTLKGESPSAKAIYKMLGEADAVGTFQVESRAQMSMLPRLKPKEFYDLVIEVAIVRPGPIEGGMASEFVRRREALRTGKPVEAEIHELLRPILRRTLGVPLFQEQIMQIATKAAGYSPGEADLLRRAMGSWREEGVIAPQREKIVGGMCANGFTKEYAERIFQQMMGFASYGFPESHAASFALITYVSSYLKRFYPAAFTAALINSQPMGFYSSSSLVRDARAHGVVVHPPCINASDFDCTLEGPDGYEPAPINAHAKQWGFGGPALRLGFCQIRGISKGLGQIVEAARQANGPFQSLDDFVRRLDQQNVAAGQRYRLLVQLASADAFAALGLSRRDALWEVAALRKRSPQLFGDQIQPVPVGLPPMSAFEHMLEDYELLELSLRAHPMEFIRDGERARGAITAAQMRETPHGRKVEVGGRVINRQHPETAKGIIFMTLEDETDVANLIVKPEVFERHRKVALGTDMMRAKGKVERVGDVVHLVVDSFQSLADQFRTLRLKSRNFH